MKTNLLEKNLLNEQYFDLYTSYIENFKKYKDMYKLNENMLFLKLKNKHKIEILKYIRKGLKDNKYEEEYLKYIDIIIVGLYGKEYAVEIYFKRENIKFLRTIPISILGRGRKHVFKSIDYLNR